MRKVILLLASHALVLAIGFAAGIYTLPILIAPEGPSDAEVAQSASTATYRATIREDLRGHDFVHWGRGSFAINGREVSLMGEVAPGPDYKLYLVPQFVQDEAEFDAVKAQSLRVGDVKSFENFIVSLPDNTDIEAYDTIVVWCERFGEFITAAKYKP